MQQPDFVREISELHAAIARVTRDVGAARHEVAGFKAILEQYHEQPQLLDPHLEALLAPLTATLSGASAALDDDARFAAVMQACRLLQALISARGHKTILRFFPNKAPDIERALTLLQKLESLGTRGGEIDEDAQDGAWQTRAVLLLWLSGLVLIPFDFGSIAVARSAFAVDEASEVPASAQWMIALGKQYLSDPGPAR